MKRFFLFIVFLGTILYESCLPSREVFAVVDPLSVANNTFGIHIVDENDLDDAAKLVNSNGGQWGYVTMVIRTDDRKRGKWQYIFDRMRKLRLIPIIRLATVAEHGVWQKPRAEDAQEWADFLSSLNWVVQNRYVILFNEPNHAGEWGGEVKPEEYAAMVRTYREKLKQQSDDFFILSAGMDEATPATANAMDAAEYLRRMVLADSDIFTLFDGIAVHSYPNPNFSGSLYATGKGTIASYEWLVRYLALYRLPDTIPIFITETGWVHAEGIENNRYFHTADDIAVYFTTAFTGIWTNKRIAAITPFILNYQDVPFDHFSWKKPGTDAYYPHYDAVAKLPKIAGEPQQRYSGTMSVEQIPGRLTTDFLYLLPLRIENTGQAIWEENSGIKLAIIGPEGSSTLHVNGLEPMRTSLIRLPLKTPVDAQTIRLAFQLFKGEQAISEVVKRPIEVTPSSSMWSKIVRLFR